MVSAPWQLLDKAKQQLCTYIAILCTFLCLHCTTTTGKCLISRFVKDVNMQAMTKFSFSL